MRKRPAAGFSLLEMVVALSVLALALGTIYQAAGGATRNVRLDEKHAYGVELARSLLADNGTVPVSGVKTAGKTSSGFKWYVTTMPVDYGRTSRSVPLLHHIEVGVSWVDAGRRGEVVLNSVVEGNVP